MNIQRFMKNAVIGMGVVIALLLLSINFIKPDFEEITKKANRDLPKMIDEMTRMERVEVKPEGVTYFYTLINFSPKDQNQTQLTQGVVESTCAKMDKQIKSSMSYRFIYQLENSKEYANILVDKKSCGL